MTSNATNPTNPARRAHSGFTMVEMLTVIGIIVILMAILLPVIGKVRIAAKVADTQNEISKISGAIEQYYAEYKSYPGPVPNSAIGTTQIQSASGGSLTITSTENLVVAVCGGLQVNTGGTVVYASTDTASSMGPLNLSQNKFNQTRHVAFIDATPGQRMPDLPWDNGSGKTGTNDSYIPEFMDRFNTPRPILYLRAQNGAPAHNGSNQVAGNDDQTTQFNYGQLLKYAIPGRGDFYKFPGADASTKDPSTIPNAAPVYATNSNTPTLWDAYLGNPNIIHSPRGLNGYILFSAGPDNIFGTQDDIISP